MKGDFSCSEGSGLIRFSRMTFPHIVRDPAILGGKPILAGTRISVELLLQALSSGMSVEDVLKEYPHLTKEAVREALAFAATELERTEIVDVERI